MTRDPHAVVANRLHVLALKIAIPVVPGAAWGCAAFVDDRQRDARSAGRAFRICSLLLGLQLLAAVGAEALTVTGRFVCCEAGPGCQPVDPDIVFCGGSEAGVGYKAENRISLTFDPAGGPVTGTASLDSFTTFDPDTQNMDRAELSGTYTYDPETRGGSFAGTANVHRKTIGYPGGCTGGTSCGDQCCEYDSVESWGASHEGKYIRGTIPGIRPFLIEVQDIQPLDLVADRLEVVQTIQDLGNHVRLVAGKRTFARFHVHSSRDRTLTTARLRIVSDPEADPISPISRAAGGSGDIQARTTPVRGFAYHAFLFELPSGLASPLTLTAEVNPSRMPEESSFANNTKDATVSFEAVPPVYLVLYDMQYTIDGVPHAIRDADAAALTGWLRRVYPLADLRVARRSVLFGSSVPNCMFVNVYLNVKRKWDLLVNLILIGPPAQVRYYGMIDDRGHAGILGGLADGIPGFVACGGTGVPRSHWNWDPDQSYGDWLGGHELGHTYGRHHAEFCGAQAAVLGIYPFGYEPYPYPDGKISRVGVGPDAIYGFDTCYGPNCVFSIINPNWYELMTYCQWRWISDFTYHRLMNTFQASGTSAAAQPLSPAADRVLVSGVIDLATAAVHLEPLFVLPQLADVEPPVPGAYAIVLRDGTLRQLARYPFTPRQTHDDPPPGSDEEPLVLAYFSEAVPYVDGTTVVDIEGPGGRLHRRSAGASAPTVQVVAPNGGETVDGEAIEVSWTASDADGDPLTFNVEYSADDAESWELVAQNVDGERTEIARLNLVGSERARVRVWVSDGVHSAHDQSDQPFSVANAPPRLSIVAPSGPITVAAGQTVHFAADAYDADLGAASGDAVEWRSSRDGVLGGGAALSTAVLSVGAHTITGVLDDGAGGVASASVDVTVVSDVAELPPLPDALDVAPVPILLDPAIGEGRETLAIENQNLGHAIAWQAAASEAWLALGATAGSTPGEVEVGFSGATLPPGSYEAIITVTSPDLAGVEERIPVDLLLRAPPVCVGDCDGGGAVAINELITGVNIALGALPLAQCPAFTRNYDGLVTIEELVAAVTNALGRCPEGPP